MRQPALIVRSGEFRINDLQHHFNNVKGGLNRINLTIKAGEIGSSPL